MLASKLKELRLSRGLSQESMARLANISLHTYSKIELGKSLPNLSTLYRIADALGIPPADLISGSDDVDSR